MNVELSYSNLQIVVVTFAYHFVKTVPTFKTQKLPKLETRYYLTPNQPPKKATNRIRHILLLFICPKTLMTKFYCLLPNARK